MKISVNRSITEVDCVKDIKKSIDIAIADNYIPWHFQIKMADNGYYGVKFKDVKKFSQIRKKFKPRIDLKDVAQNGFIEKPDEIVIEFISIEEFNNSTPSDNKGFSDISYYIFIDVNKYEDNDELKWLMKNGSQYLLKQHKLIASYK